MRPYVFAEGWITGLARYELHDHSDCREGFRRENLEFRQATRHEAIRRAQAIVPAHLEASMEVADLRMLIGRLRPKLLPCEDLDNRVGLFVDHIGHLIDASGDAIVVVREQCGGGNEGRQGRQCNAG